MLQRISIFSLTIFISLYFSLIAQATPPLDLKINYDKTAKILHIQMAHVSSNVRDHHIRQITVFKNDESVKVVRLVTQKTGREVSQDVSVDAKAGDVLRVKAICSEAGIAEANVTISKEKTEKEKDAAKDAVQEVQIDKEVQEIPAAEIDPAMTEKKTGY